MAIPKFKKRKDIFLPSKHDVSHNNNAEEPTSAMSDSELLVDNKDGKRDNGSKNSRLPMVVFLLLIFGLSLVSVYLFRWNLKLADPKSIEYHSSANINVHTITSSSSSNSGDSEASVNDPHTKHPSTETIFETNSENNAGEKNGMVTNAATAEADMTSSDGSIFRDPTIMKDYGIKLCPIHKWGKGDRAPVCHDFNEYQQSKTSNGENIKLNPKIMLSSGCSMSTSVQAMLRNLFYIHRDKGTSTNCGMFEPKKKWIKDFCSDKKRIGGNGTKSSLATRTASYFATFDKLYGEKSVVAKFNQGSSISYDFKDIIENEERWGIHLDLVSVYRKNLLDRLLCDSIDCFGIKGVHYGQTVFRENGTISEHCFDRRKLPNQGKDIIAVKFPKDMDFRKVFQFYEKKIVKGTDGGSLGVLDQYVAEDLLGFTGSDDPKVIDLSITLWYNMLCSLKVENANKTLVEWYIKHLKETKYTEPKKLSPTSKKLYNPKFVRDKFLNDPQLKPYSWMWRD